MNANTHAGVPTRRIAETNADTQHINTWVGLEGAAQNSDWHTEGACLNHYNSGDTDKLTLKLW